MIVYQHYRNSGAIHGENKKKAITIVIALRTLEREPLKFQLKQFLLERQETGWTTNLLLNG
jgi:hypothetical protein